MTIVAKILPVRHTGYFDTVKGEFCPAAKAVAIDLDDTLKIKETIINLLFHDGPKTVDYLVVAYGDKTYLVERDSETSYCKKEITYHPLLSKVKLTA
jgi:hypothetical protein